MEIEPDLHEFENERTAHRAFILRHIDFITELLAGEQANSQWRNPCGCPKATPALLAHRMGKGARSSKCVYQRIAQPGHDKASCCEDPLAGSDDPLDTVAASVLARKSGVSTRYFDHLERRLILTLRETLGDWESISRTSVEELHSIMADSTAISIARVERLHRALRSLSEHRLLDTLTLRDLPAVPYGQLQTLFAELPGINQQEAWWLVLTALDKPVWPADPDIDRLLCELGLLSQSDLDGEQARHRGLEEQFIDRQIEPLHRTLAAHSQYCDCASDPAHASCELRKFILGYRQDLQQNDTDLMIADLFAGAGGLSHGFTRAGYGISFAVDQDREATDTYRLNHPEIPHTQVKCEDIASLARDTEFLNSFTEEVDVIVGGPPCQALSVAGYRARLANVDDYSVLDDPRTTLYQDYVNIVEKLEPTALVMENVEGILSEIGDSGVRVIDDIEEALSDTGYAVDHRLLDCSNYGIPQTRDRVVLMGIRRATVADPKGKIDDLFQSLEQRSHDQIVTIRQALANLPRISRGGGAAVVGERAPGSPGRYLGSHSLASGTKLTYNHRAREHKMEKDQILFDEALEPGETGWDVKYGKDGEYSHLIEYNVGSEESPAFKDKYRMLEWDAPSPTIVAHLQKDGNSFILPDYYRYANPDATRADDSRNRGLTPREAARIQSFPDDYIFLGSYTGQFKQIGNAVPPLLGEHIARVLADHLTGSSHLASTKIPDRETVSGDD